LGFQLRCFSHANIGLCLHRRSTGEVGHHGDFQHPMLNVYSSLSNCPGEVQTTLRQSNTCHDFFHVALFRHCDCCKMCCLFLFADLLLRKHLLHAFPRFVGTKHLHFFNPLEFVCGWGGTLKTQSNRSRKHERMIAMQNHLSGCSIITKFMIKDASLGFLVSFKWFFFCSEVTKAFHFFGARK